MRVPKTYLSYLFSTLYLTGCVATTTDIDRLQESMNTVQKSQADLVVKMDELDRSLTALQEKLDENQKRMSTLSQKLDDTQIKLGGRMEMISELLSAATKQAAVPVPREIYRTIEGDYLAGKLDLAISGFKSFLERYPDNDLADLSRFNLADSYLQKKNYPQALEEFDRVAKTSHDYRPRALLKRSYVLEAMKSPVAQKETLKTLIKESPDTPEAQTAQQILKELEKETPKEPAPKKKSP